MIVPRDFTFNKEALISYYYNLQQFVGRKISQTRIKNLLQEQNPGNDYYNALDRKFATIKFYGFVYFNGKGELMFNEYFEEYVNYLEENIIDANSFLNILLASNYEYYKNSKTNFFKILIELLKNESILYLDQIDIILYLQHFDQLNDFDELVGYIKKNRSYNFINKIGELENFYNNNNLEISVRAHDATYLFTFLENNGFYTAKNSLQTKIYYQADGTPRTLRDRRLYLSKDLLKHINGFSYESIVDEIEYNSINEDELYENLDEEVAKLIDKSEETRLAIIKRYKADIKLRNNALEKSGYLCEIAKLKGFEHKTFKSRRHDFDYAEVHHLIPMHAQENELFFQGDQLISLDQISNLIVLCPNCHSKLHYGKNEDVRVELESLFNDREEALKKNKIIIRKQDLLAFYNI